MSRIVSRLVRERDRQAASREAHGYVNFEVIKYYDNNILVDLRI